MDTELLPVMVLSLQDTGSSYEIVVYKLGPLRCYQGKI